MPVDFSLAAPERNRYFYGLLMDAERWEKDTLYFIQKSQLLNRLVTGAGVVCGLGLTFDPNSGVLTLQPGVAIDRAGRQVIVPSATAVDLTHLTDSTGTQTTPTPSGATVLISLAYAEQNTDPVAVLVPDCDHPGACAPSTIEESFAIVITIAGPVAPPPGCSLPGGFPLPTGTQLPSEIAGQVTTACANVPSDPSIPLARFTLASGPLDQVSDRLVVYSNALLFQLILCLAERVASLQHP